MTAIDMDKCFAGKQVVTAKQFEALGPGAKGYLVYMLGSRKDQPHVPENYRPSPGEIKQFAAGQQQAIIEAQDNP